MTQRAWIDAMRCLLYENAAAVDRAAASADAAERQRWEEIADLLHPAVEGAVHRRRQRDDVAGAAGPRRHGLRRGDRRRAALPRHPHRRHLRGHQRDPGRRPRRAQAVDAGGWRSCSSCSTRSAPTPTASARRPSCAASVRTCTPRSAPPGRRPSTWSSAPRTDPNALLVGVDAVPEVARHRRVRRLARPRGAGGADRPPTATPTRRRSATPSWCRRGSSASRSCPPRSACWAPSPPAPPTCSPSPPTNSDRASNPHRTSVAPTLQCEQFDLPRHRVPESGRHVRA